MNPEQNESQREFEKAWESLKAPINETVTSKWYFQQAWKAACASTEKRLLASRVVGPSDKNIIEAGDTYPQLYELVHMNADTPRLSGAEYLTFGVKYGARWYRDNLKLVPLTIEQFFPREKEMLLNLKSGTTDYDSGLLSAYYWLRDFISKRLGGM